MNLPRFLWRFIQLGPRLAYAAGLAAVVGRFVLLLSTTGRRSGRARVTPLTYEELDGTFLVASARGTASDWFRNILRNPAVVVRVGRRRFVGQAEVITDQGRIADYLQRRMARSPRMFGLIFRMEGLPTEPTRQLLEQLAAQRPMVAIRPSPA